MNGLCGMTMIIRLAFTGPGLQNFGSRCFETKKEYFGVVETHEGPFHVIEFVLEVFRATSPQCTEKKGQ